MKSLSFIILFFLGFSVKTEANTPGKPIPISWIASNKTQIVDYKTLENIFLHPDIVNRAVYVVTVTGPAQSGKSFLLDQCSEFLRNEFKYIRLETKLDCQKRAKNDSRDSILSFDCERVGMSIFSDVFLYDDKHDHIAIILVEAEGLVSENSLMFDPVDDVKMFAFGALISSVQIYNSIEVLQQYNFDSFKKSTNLAQIIQNKPTDFRSKPFQSLMFLMRDWNNEKFCYGSREGKKYLNVILPESSKNKNYTVQTFEDISCFLMPKPMDDSPYFINFNTGLTKEFKKSMEELNKHLFNPENFVKKTVSDVAVDGKSYHSFIKTQFEIFQNVSDQDPSTIMRDIFENHKKASLELYEKDRAKLMKNGLKASESHEKAKETAMNNLKSFNLVTGTKYFHESLSKLDKSFAEMKNDQKSKILLIVVVLTSSLVVVSVFVILIVLMIKKCRNAKIHYQEMELTDVDDDKWQIERERIEQLYSIGRGNFGEVFKGILKPKDDKTTSNEIVAIKTVKIDRGEGMSDFDVVNLKEETEKKLVNEARRMTKLSSNFILKLRGYCLRDKPYMMVIEYAEHGDLRTFLLKHRDRLRQPQTPTSNKGYVNIIINSGSDLPVLRPLHQMALEIADGMAYLEKMKFVHRDLAARNCMVTSDFTVKIGDFGMSRLVDVSNYYTLGNQKSIPIRWMAPESITSGKFSSKSDVFSFGILLWEMVTLGETPYPTFELGVDLKNFIKSGGIMTKPRNCSDTLYSLMRNCWKYEKTSRPNFRKIIKSLTAMTTNGDEDFIWNFKQDSYVFNQSSNRSKITSIIFGT